MQTQIDEAHAAIIHEKEAAKLAIEQAPPVIKEVPVVDNTKLEILKNHNEKLEVMRYNLASKDAFHINWMINFRIKLSNHCISWN